MTEIAAYAGLFLSALVAATLLPAQSEAALVGLLLADYSPALLVIVASVGNVLGSAINWLLGRWIDRLPKKSWLPSRDGERMARFEAWYRRYGKWSLLLSWAPIIGDPLTIVAGVLREPFPIFLLLVTIAKAGRYIVLTAMTLYWV